jgi:hypothetical protein
MSKTEPLIIIILIIFLLLNACISETEKGIRGHWVVLELYSYEKLLLPDTSGSYSYYPSMSFFQHHYCSIPTLELEDNSVLGKHKVFKEDGKYKLQIYESLDTNLLGIFDVRIFEDENFYFKEVQSAYMELTDSNFYMILKKNGPLR